MSILCVRGGWGLKSWERGFENWDWLAGELGTRSWEDGSGSWERKDENWDCEVENGELGLGIGEFEQGSARRESLQENIEAGRV